MCYKLRSQYKKMRYHCQVCQHINNDIADVCIICLMPLTEFKIKYIPCFNIDELVDIDFRYKIFNLIIKKVKKRTEKQLTWANDFINYMEGLSDKSRVDFISKLLQDDKYVVREFLTNMFDNSFLYELEKNIYDN